MMPNRKWYPEADRKSAPENENGMDFGFLDFFLNFFSLFIFFHQLKDKLDQIKEKIYWQRKL